MIELSAYLNINFDHEPFEERVDLVAEAGYAGFEFLGWEHDLETIAAKRDEHDLDLVYMSGSRPELSDPEQSDEAVENVEWSVGLAEEMGCRKLNVKSGPRQRGHSTEAQYRAIVDVLRRAAPAAEEAGVTLVLEPINYIDGPTTLVNSSHQGYRILEAVDSPNVKLLFDTYHEQIVNGDVIRNIREHGDLIGHYHVVDAPTQNEPGTGELNFENVVAAIEGTGYDGYLGCEFIPTGDPVETLRDVKGALGL